MVDSRQVYRGWLGRPTVEGTLTQSTQQCYTKPRKPFKKMITKSLLDLFILIATMPNGQDKDNNNTRIMTLADVDEFLANALLQTDRLLLLASQDRVENPTSNAPNSDTKTED
jgi:hypothetical protein